MARQRITLPPQEVDKKLKYVTTELSQKPQTALADTEILGSTFTTFCMRVFGKLLTSLALQGYIGKIEDEKPIKRI